MDPGDSPPPTDDSAARPFEPADLVGTLFADRFRVTRLVGTGSKTAILDATDEHNGRTVTLKLVRPRLSASPRFRAKFDESMRGVAALSHSNIAAVYDWGVARAGDTDTSTAYVVNEHLTGGSLRDMFDRGRKLSPSQALAIGLDVCRALDHAHRRRFAHTELTPSKIVFGDDRRLRIIDFGLARLLGASTWAQPDSVPTHVAWYAAPEQGLGLPVDGKADVYALGLVLHEAVTGAVPFKSDSTVACLAARVGRLMPVSADLGPLAAVLERAGRPDADERSTAAELGKALLQVAAKMPRPEPLPLLSTGLFDTPLEQMRTPDDPTGGVHRPPSGDTVAPIVLVPLDEPSADSDPELETGVDDHADDHAAGDADIGVAAALVAEPEPAAAATDVVAAQPASVPEPLLDDELASAPATGAAPLVILPLDAGDIGGIGPDGDADGELDGGQLPRANATTQMPVVVADVESLPRARRRFPWRIVFGVLVLAALAALGVLATQLFRTPTYVVPELAGLPEAEARNTIAANEWVVDVQRERSDEVPVVGQVVRTAPAAGVELAERQPFLLVVSDGPLLRTLPDSTGLTSAAAQAALTALQLEQTVLEQADEVVPIGTVISWSVPGDATLSTGAQVEPATLIELVVSTGPAPRTVPNLIGRTTVDAQTEIESLGLVFSVADQVFSDDAALGAIISQTVPEGTQVERGSGVAVVLSKGPDLIVYPDLTGATTYDAAAAILGPVGFVPTLTFGDTAGEIRNVTIDGDPPVVGQSYRRGTVVEFTAL